MADFLEIIARSVRETIEAGYYETETAAHERRSLKDAILSCIGNPIIAEVKPASPSRGVIKKDVKVADVTASMQSGGAVGISVLTEPKHFQGSLHNFNTVRKTAAIPLLMKDFIISAPQVDAASNIGADAILLIQALFDRGYCDRSVDEMIELAHSRGMEVLLEAHTAEEFRSAATSSSDLLGINNRNLATLDVDLRVTEKVLEKNDCGDRIVISESGIESPEHIRFLRSAGARAFLVGTAIMSSQTIEEKVRELVEA